VITELTCEQARDLAPEYGLGILDPDERGAMAAHLLRCPECRREADGFARLGDQLLEVIPAAEPSPGFDRRVLEARRPGRRTPGPRWLVGGVGAALAVAAAAVATVLVLSAGPQSSPDIRASLVANGQNVGTVYTEGKPPNFWMVVKDIGASGTVACQVVSADGRIVTLGSFDLVDGSGSWATPEPSGLGRITSARLIAADGKILAQATFTS